MAKSGTATTHFKGDTLAKNSKISLKEAHAIALKAVPGKITDEELETEKVAAAYVDAKTGKLLENSKDGPNHDKTSAVPWVPVFSCFLGCTVNFR